MGFEGIAKIIHFSTLIEVDDTRKRPAELEE